MSKDVYESPLSSRYASPYMLHLFSADMRFQTWRRLWTALARAEHELGLPITAEQVAELEAHITDIGYAVAEQREREVRHDVMAHVYAYGKAAPSAAASSTLVRRAATSPTTPISFSTATACAICAASCSACWQISPRLLANTPPCLPSATRTISPHSL